MSTVEERCFSDGFVSEDDNFEFKMVIVSLHDLRYIHYEANKKGREKMISSERNQTACWKIIYLKRWLNSVKINRAFDIYFI